MSRESEFIGLCELKKRVDGVHLAELPSDDYAELISAKATQGNYFECRVSGCSAKMVRAENKAGSILLPTYVGGKSDLTCKAELDDQT